MHKIVAPEIGAARFLANLMDIGRLSLCGAGCFETGTDHICEKDEIWAVLAWFSIIAHKNKDKKVSEKLVHVVDITKENRATYGRYGYKECEFEGAIKMVEHLLGLISNIKEGKQNWQH